MGKGRAVTVHPCHSALRLYPAGRKRVTLDQGFI